MKRNIIISCLCLALAVMAAAGASLAYFTDTKAAENTFTVGDVKIDLLETAVKDGELAPFEDVVGVMPGSEVSKIVEVKNIGESDAYIRISVEKAITLAENREGEVDLSLVKLDINTADWTEQDGYYYYNSALKPNETTAPLFTTVSFSADMGNLYQNSSLTIGVTAEATQVANNGASALTANGWPQA